MEKAGTYNGWTNYETWNVKLWLDNDQGEHDYWLLRSWEVDGDVYALENELKDAVYENYPDIPPSMYSDILNAGLSSVNWREIAEAMIEDAKE